MKLKINPFLAPLALASAGSLIPAFAADAIKIGSETDLTSTDAGVWSGGSGLNGSPTAADKVIWNAGSNVGNQTIATDIEWNWMQFSSLTGALNISGPGVITLNRTGNVEVLNASNAGQAITIGNEIRLTAGGTAVTVGGTENRLAFTTSGTGSSLTLGDITANGQAMANDANVMLRGAGTITVNGVLTIDGQLYSGDNGTRILNSANSIGWVFTNNGALLAGHNQAFGAGTIYFGSGGGTPTLASKDGTARSFANALDFNVGTTNFGQASGGTGALSFVGGVELRNANRNINTVVDTTFSGSVVSTGTSGGITKQGAGTLTLSGDNTFSGTTNIAGGTLRLAHTNALRNSTLNHTGNTLQFDESVGSNQFTFGGLSGNTAIALQNTAATGIALSVGGNNASTSYAGDLTGAGSLVKDGTGILTLSGTHSYTGGTTVNQGALSLLSTSAKTGNINVAAGATLGLSVSGANAFTSANVDSLFADTLENVTMNATSFVGIDTTNGSFTYASSVSDTTRGLHKLGTNTLTLSGDNAYTGGTIITAGTIIAAHDNALGTGSAANSIAAGGGLTVNAGIKLTQDGAITMSASENTSAGRSQITLGNTSELSNNIILNYSGLTGSGNAFAQINGNGNSIANAATFAGNVSFTGGAANAAGGNNILVLRGGSGGTAYGKATGTIDLLTNNATGTGIVRIVDTGSRWEFSGAGNRWSALQFNANQNVYVGAIDTLSSEGVLSGGGGNGTGTVHLNNFAEDEGFRQTVAGIQDGETGGKVNVTSTHAATLTLAGAGNYTSSGVIGGSVALTKSGSGTQTLTGANTYTGGTIVSEGTLQIGNGTVNGTVNGTYAVASGATLRLNRNTNAAISWSSVTGAGTFAITGATNLDYEGNPTALSSEFTGTLQVEKGRVLATNEVGSGLGGTTNVVVQNGGQFAMWNGGTFSQNFTIAGTGWGELGQPGALRMGNAGNNVTINGSVTLSGDATVIARGNSQNTFNGVISGDHKLSIGGTGPATYIFTKDNSYGETVITGSGGSLSTVQIGNGGTSGTLGLGDVTNDGAIRFNRSDEFSVSNAISGTGAVIQAGTGSSLTLSGVSTYTGATTVSAGTLLVTGALGNTAVSVGADGMLGGTGILGGSLHFEAGAKLDIVDIANALSISGNVTFVGFGFEDITGWDYMNAEAGTYTLLAGSGFDLTNVSNVGAGAALDFGNGKQGYFQNGSLQMVIIPEPSAAALLGGMGLLALLRRRRAR